MKDHEVHRLPDMTMLASAPKTEEVIVTQPPAPTVPIIPDPVHSGLGVSPWVIFGGVFVVSSIGGIAALLRSGQEITRRDILSAALNSGMIGLIIALTMWSKFGGDDPYLLIGVSVLAGLGGATTIDFIIQYIGKKFGLTSVRPRPAEPRPRRARK